MTEESRIRYFAYEVIPFIWQKYKFGKIDLRPMGDIPPPGIEQKEVVEDLKKVIWVRLFVTISEWKNFVKTHYDHMVSSFEAFVQYSAFSCYYVKDVDQNPYDRFLTVFALFTHFALYAYSRDVKHKNLIQLVPMALVKFYVMELIAGIESVNGWGSFHEHLQKSPYLQKYDAVEKHLATQCSFSSVYPTILAIIKSPRIKLNSSLTGLTREDVEEHQPSKSFSTAFEDWKPFPFARGSRSKKGKKRATASSTRIELYAPLPRETDDGPSDEVIDHFFGKQYKFVGDNVIYVGRTAREAIMHKADECLALIYDEVDYTIFLIDLALKDLDNKIAEIKQTTRAP